MAVSRPQLTSPRAVGVACAVSATALGLLYLNAAGAPARHLIVNALSLVLGLAIFAVIPPRVRRSRASGAIVLALGIMLLATAMCGATAILAIIYVMRHDHIRLRIRRSWRRPLVLQRDVTEPVPEKVS